MQDTMFVQFWRIPGIHLLIRFSARSTSQSGQERLALHRGYRHPHASSEMFHWKSNGARFQSPVQSKNICLSFALSLSLSYLIWRIYRYPYTFQINELKLLVLQQQSYIQKLELQNKEMDMVLQGLLFPADEVRSILVNNQMKIRFIWHLGIITHHNCTEYYE